MAGQGAWGVGRVIPGYSSARPRHTTGLPDNDLGEKSPHGPKSADRQPNRRAVRGVVEVDLSRHVDRGGGLWDDARVALDRALCALPPGLLVRVRIGRALYAFDTVLDTLADLTVDAAGVEIVGRDDRGVAQFLDALRGER
jgi:hypothetical protein